MKVLCIGTGCCGFLQMYTYLQNNGINTAYKGSKRKYQNSNEIHSPLSWSFDQSSDINSVKQYMNSINGYDADIGHYFLPYISIIIKLYPNIKILCLDGGKTSILYLTDQWGYCNPLTSLYRNVNTRMKIEHFPCYEGKTNIEAVTEFYKIYYNTCKKLQEKFPNNINIIETYKVHPKYNYELPSTNFVYTTSLSGGLGNMLFQMSEVIAWCKEFNRPNPVFNIYTDNEKLFPPYYNFDVFLNGHSGSWDKLTSTFPNISWGINGIQATFNHKFVTNDMFSFKRVHHMRDTIINSLAPSDETIQYINNKYNDTYNEKTVSLHYRTWTRSSDSLTSKHTQIQSKWYERVLDTHFDTNVTVMIFSDNIALCKERFAHLTKRYKFVFVDEDQFISLFMIAKCDGHILHGSTYSFWGAYLDTKQPKCKTIIPPVFYKIHNNSQNMIPYKEWIIYS